MTTESTLWTPSRRSILMAGAAGLVGLGLSACSPDSAVTDRSRKANAGAATDGAVKKGGLLRVGLFGGGNANETISPVLAVGLADIARVFQLYEPLFAAGDKGELTPKLAVSASANAAADVWTFELRQGVIWHDGKPFTADDVVYTVKQSWGNAKNLFNSALALIVDFAGVTKVSDHTVRIPLKLGVAEFPSITAFPNLYIVQNGTKDFTKGIGTGPFKMGTFKPGTSVFDANKNYWREGQPYVDQLLISSTYQSQESRLNALLAGDIDIAPQTTSALAAANEKSGRLVLGNQPGPACVPMIMRVSKGELAEPKIRQALKLIPDRQVFVDNVFNGYGTVSIDALGQTDPYFADDLPHQQDLEQAKSLLKSIGKSDLNVELRTSSVVDGMNEIATLFKQQALGAGVTVNLKLYPPTTYYSASAGVFDRDFCLDFASQGLNSLSLIYLTWNLPKAPYNQSGFGADAADRKLMLDAISEADRTKAAEKWRAVQEGQVKDGPYIIPATQNWLDAYSLKVRGVQTTTAYTCGGYDFAGGWLA